MVHQQGGGYQPPFGILEHYYGDIVRMLFVGIAVVIGLCIPFLADRHLGVVIGVPFVVVLILLAGLTNPRGRIVLLADLIVSIIGIFFSEVTAISAYDVQAWGWLAILEFVAMLFFVTAYFSVKTVRAMAMRKIGRHDSPAEFEDSALK